MAFYWRTLEKCKHCGAYHIVTNRWMYGETDWFFDAESWRLVEICAQPLRPRPLRPSPRDSYSLSEGMEQLRTQ